MTELRSKMINTTENGGKVFLGILKQENDLDRSFQVKNISVLSITFTG